MNKTDAAEAALFIEEDDEFEDDEDDYMGYDTCDEREMDYDNDLDEDDDEDDGDYSGPTPGEFDKEDEE